jgi:hypothetical protein
MNSNTPPQQPAKQIVHAFLAARGSRHHRKAGRASPKMVTNDWTTVSGSSMGTTPNPFSERRIGIRLVHPNPKAITRKAVAGWRAIRRLSPGEEVGGW